jgi:hypothetical protein
MKADKDKLEFQLAFEQSKCKLSEDIDSAEKTQ